MNSHYASFSISTHDHLEIIDITSHVRSIVQECKIQQGLTTIWIGHTTAAIAVNERDPSLWQDMLSTFTRLVPINALYHHNEKYTGLAGEQNAHAHILSTFIKPDVTIPLRAGNLVLGSWQAILFIELDGPRNRHVEVHVMGDS